MWIEVNIECPIANKNDFLILYVKPVVEEYTNRIQSWHFLWESDPYPCTLIVRFCGEENTLIDLSIQLEIILQQINHCYGRNGDCITHEEYNGEADTWGDECWERGVQFLNFGSEFALELVENRNQLGNSTDYRKDVFGFADRYTHLFLIQISSLLNEVDFYLLQGISRFAAQEHIELSDAKRSTILRILKQIIRLTG